MNATQSKPTTRDEFYLRAIERAQIEKLTATKLADGRFLVRSRYLAPGTYHTLTVDAQGQIHCDAACPSGSIRGTCAHIGAVARRIARESKRPLPAPRPWQDSRQPARYQSCAGCSEPTTRRSGTVALCASCQAREVARSYAECFQD